VAAAGGEAGPRRRWRKASAAVVWGRPDGGAAALGAYDHGNCGRPTFCLRPIATMVPVGPWFCPDCAPPLKHLKRREAYPWRLAGPAHRVGGARP